MLRLLDGAPLPAPLAPGDGPSESMATAEASREGATSFARVLETVASTIDHGEALVSSARHAAYAPMDAGALIALQAGIYRYSEAIDLTAKVVDRTTSGVRTVLQGGH